MEAASVWTNCLDLIEGTPPGLWPIVGLSLRVTLSAVTIAALVGLFSQQAAEKLKDIASAIFTKSDEGKDHQPPASSERSESAPAKLSVAAISPNEGPLGGGQDVTITGEGFLQDAAVRVGTLSATDVQVVNSTSIKAKTPLSQQAGKVDVVVSNPDNQSSTLSNGFTYTNG